MFGINDLEGMVNHLEFGVIQDEIRGLDLRKNTSTLAGGKTKVVSQKETS